MPEPPAMCEHPSTPRVDTTAITPFYTEVNEMRHTRVLTTFLVTLTLAATAGAPAVVAQDDAVTLRLAISDSSERPSQAAIDAFLAHVESLSGGSIVIEPGFDAGADTPEGFEVGVAGLVKRGDADLGLVASRAWDLAGVSSLQALQAPFLITDDALAAAVATSAIADDLLAGMAQAGVTGLALWPEDLRHPFSFRPEVPLVSPADFAGATILVQPSALSRSLVTALGGNLYVDGDRDADVAADLLHGAESGLLQGQSLPGTPTATGDVVFYPKFQVLVANSAAFARLSESQQAVLREAAIATRDDAIANHAPETDAAAAWCAAGGRVVLAGPEAITAFEAAARPVFDAIAADPVTAAAIDAIDALKARTTPPASAAACEPDGKPSDSATDPQLEGFRGDPIPDGTYRIAVTVADLLEAGATEEFARANGGGIWTLTIAGPGWTASQQRGSYTENCAGDILTVDGPAQRLPTTYDAGCVMDADLLWRPAPDGVEFKLIAVGGDPEHPNVRQDGLVMDRVWTRID